ncbi:hypothetical protein BGX29_007379 [Mortierella sp. GBA35]|nr:hypothetical protein BGX29_007379 [Mortierella sp. GBA35]
MNVPSIFYLPHILESIREFLDPSNYIACSLVCLEWSKVFGPHTWRSFVFKRRDYKRLLAVPAMEQRFLDRASTIREVNLEGGEFPQALSLFLLKHPSLFKNRLTRLSFREWYPRNTDMSMWQESHRTMEAFMDWSRDSIESVEFQFHSRSTTSGPGILYRVPATQIADMSSLTSITLKGPSIKIGLDTLLLCLANCPEQVQVLNIEHPVDSQDARSGHIATWDVPEHLRSTSVPPDNRTSCHCKARLEEVWTRVAPTRIRVLTLPEILDSEEERPILLPFLRRRCPNLLSLKIKYLGIPLGLLASSLNRDLFPDLRHLELDGIRSHMAANYQNMFPIYKLLLDDIYPALESLTISEDSDLVDDVPQFVALVLTRHAATLKTVRWLGSAGKVNERLDLEWFLKSCPNLERVEITGNHRFCSSGQSAVGTVIITDTILLDRSNDLSHKLLSEPLPPLSLSSPLPPLPLVPILEPCPSRVGSPTSSLSTMSWVCGSSLTYLDVSFRPSPEVKREHQYKVQIEHFYKKLGQMTALVELHVGCECRCRGKQLKTCQHTECKDQPSVGTSDAAADLLSDTGLQEKNAEETVTTIFDMSLSTGLGHLAGLSKLRVLNISRIHGHRVGEAELEWMRSHWTKLRVLQGIKMQHIVDWAKASWPRLDVVFCNCAVTDRKLRWK